MSKELKVGIFSFAGLLLLLVAIVVTNKINLTQRGYYLNLRYSSVSDLKKGSAIVFAGGIRVGFVKDITMVSNRLNVRCWVEDKYHIDRNAMIILTSSGLMGDKFVNVEVFAPSGEYFKPNDVIQGVDPVSLDALTIKIGNALNSLFGEAFMSEDMKKSFVYMLKNTSELMYNLNNTVRDNEANVAKSVAQVEESIALVSKNLKIMVASLNYTLQNVEGLSRAHKADIELAIVNLQKASVVIEQSSHDLQVVLANSRHITDAVRNQQGTAGKLVYDKAMYQSLMRTAQNLEEFSAKIKKNPSLLIKGF